MINYDKEYGVILTASGDGGDSCSNTFRLLYAKYINGNPDHDLLLKAMKAFFILPGILVRHPIMFNDPSDLSRDQQTPAVITLEAYGGFGAVLDIYTRHMARGWRYQNLDWATQEHKNYYFPKEREISGDIEMCLNSIIRVIDSYLRPDKSVGIDINHIMALLQAAVSGHSFWTRMACKIYKYRRKGPQFAMDWFHRNDYPDISIEFKEPIKKYILDP